MALIRYLRVVSSLVVLATPSVDSFLRHQPPLSSKHHPTLQAASQQDQEQQQIKVSLKPYTTNNGLDAKELEKRIQGITAIASDVDGTLLSTDHTLSEMTKNAIKRAVREASQPQSSSSGKRLRYFFPATGKTRKGALDSLGPEMRDLLSQLPGVFCQGLYCVDGEGKVVFERKLPLPAIAAAEAMAAKFLTTIIGNFEDCIYGNAVGDPTLLAAVNAKWGEPIPTIVPSLAKDGPQFHKLVFMSTDVDMLRDDMRPKLEVLARENGATVTTSHPTILELLPEGCSKALGVQKLCEALGIDPGTELLAMGDAENDKGMLEMAAIGVAVGNASPVAKAAADVVLEERSDDGAAGLAMEHFSPLRDGSNKTL